MNAVNPLTRNMTDLEFLSFVEEDVITLNHPVARELYQRLARVTGHAALDPLHPVLRREGR